MKGLFIASTGQHVGKTTTSIGLVAGFKKMLGKAGFMKPVGQEHVAIDNLFIDKDVILFKNQFGLQESYEDMSPVVITKGFTRDFLDGKHKTQLFEEKIRSAYLRISNNNPMTIVEGTGHLGVGSIIDMNNAKVAKLLGLDMLLLASGGLGGAIDSLAPNIALCEKYGVRIKGVILNRVKAEKREMILDYMGKALKKTFALPLLGCIPFDPMLSSPSLFDYELLFETGLQSGKDFHFRRFKKQRLIATSLEDFKETIAPNELYILPGAREEIIRAVLARHLHMKIDDPKSDLGSGLILTGTKEPSALLMQHLKEANIPVLFAKMDSFHAMETIASFTSKFRTDDTEKINEAIKVVSENIYFNQILD